MFVNLSCIRGTIGSRSFCLIIPLSGRLPFRNSSCKICMKNAHCSSSRRSRLTVRSFVTSASGMTKGFRVTSGWCCHCRHRLMNRARESWRFGWRKVRSHSRSKWRYDGWGTKRRWGAITQNRCGSALLFLHEGRHKPRWLEHGNSEFDCSNKSLNELPKWDLKQNATHLAPHVPHSSREVMSNDEVTLVLKGGENEVWRAQISFMVLLRFTRAIHGNVPCSHNLNEVEWEWDQMKLQPNTAQVNLCKPLTFYPL